MEFPIKDYSNKEILTDTFIVETLYPYFKNLKNMNTLYPSYIALVFKERLQLIEDVDEFTIFHKDYYTRDVCFKFFPKDVNTMSCASFIYFSKM